MRLLRLTVVAIVLGAGTASAGPFTVETLSTQYSTLVKATLSTGDGTIVTTSREITSGSPINDVLTVAELPRALAVTDLLKVQARTETAMGHAWAEATSILEFNPLASGIADLDFLFIGFSQVWWSDGRISLTDLTTQSVLWDYGWDCCFFKNSTMPWAAPPDYNGQADLTISQYLDNSHRYSLSLFAATNADADREGLTISVSGLRTVPEPSTLLLLATSAALAIHRRRTSPQTDRRPAPVPPLGKARWRAESGKSLPKAFVSHVL